MIPSKIPSLVAPFVDPSTGYLTRTGNNFLQSLVSNSNAAVAGSVATPTGSGLAGGGAVADGITLEIAPNGVTNAMIRQSAGFSVIGRAFGTDGNVGDITATANNRVLARIGDDLAFFDVSLIPATVADGDYGDITVSGTGAVWTIDPHVVTFAKFVAATQKCLVGATVAGDFGEITLGTGVSITAGVLSATGSGGTVTSVSVVTANGFSGTVATATTTPAITLSYAGQALTKTDDTNVTLSLGGSPTTALLAAASLTLGWTGTLGVARGGTNIGSYAIGDILYASGATTLSKLAGVATGNALISGGVTTAPSWGKIGLTTHVSGTLPIANGGTNQTSLGDITKTNDTNVTLTLGGTPTGAVITSTSFTLGWTGTLAVSRGGLGVGTVTGLLQGNGTSAVTAITDSSTTGQVLRVTGTSTYAWGALSLSTAAAITGTLPVANGGTGVTTSTGTTNVVLSAGPTLTTVTVSSGGINVTGTSTFNSPVNFGGNLLSSTDSRNLINLYNSAVIEMHAIGGFSFQDHTGTVDCTITTSGVAPLSTTTASAANVFQSASGTVLLRSTSSARYKTDIRDLSDAEADKVLRLRPITYRSKAVADDGRRLHWGLIAEEVAGQIKPLVHLNEDGEPESVQYERIIVGLISVARRLEARVAALEALPSSAG